MSKEIYCALCRVEPATDYWIDDRPLCDPCWEKLEAEDIADNERIEFVRRINDGSSLDVGPTMAKLIDELMDSARCLKPGERRAIDGLKRRHKAALRTQR